LRIDFERAGEDAREHLAGLSEGAAEAEFFFNYRLARRGVKKVVREEGNGLTGIRAID
jgi:hypothetical protein